MSPRSGGERMRAAVASHRLRNAVGLAIVLAIAVVAVWALVDRGGRSTVTVTVEGRTAHVAPGTTLRELTTLLVMRRRAGNLLDVEGEVLRQGAFPGQILVAGRTASPGRRLRAGDRLRVIPGHDRTEPLSRQFVRVPGGVPGNPQFSLARTPGSQVVVRGSFSHKLVSTRFRPSSDRTMVEREVALTFDDGPSPKYTPRILSALKRLHAPATFFVVGYLADQYPSLVRREVKGGMVVGNHTYNHPEVPPFDELPPRLLADEIALGRESLSRLGIRPRLFRPPGGSASQEVVRAAGDVGERVVLWSVDPGDWRSGIQARQIAQGVLRAVRPGSLVILHDGGGDRAATVAALPAIVKGIRRRGLRLVAITPG